MIRPAAVNFEFGSFSSKAKQKLSMRTCCKNEIEQAADTMDDQAKAKRRGILNEIQPLNTEDQAGDSWFLSLLNISNFSEQQEAFHQVFNSRHFF